MHEETKLAEANYFYSRMLLEAGDRDAFIFNLSAFLSSARSVLQYALKEAQTKTGGQQWYDEQIGASNVLSFFKDKRDINIHTEPVKAHQHTTVELKATLHLSSSLSIKVFDAQGNLKSEYNEQPKPAPKQSDSSPKITHRFTFPDWAGGEDIPALCQLYIDELKRVVQDGLSKGFLTK